MIREEHELPPSPGIYFGFNDAGELVQQEREPRVIERTREVTSYPVVTWVFLVIGIGWILFTSAWDFLYWRCMSCDAAFWLWKGSLLETFKAEYCLKCGEAISEMGENFDSFDRPGDRPNYCISDFSSRHREIDP
jgi:hypothetical protein